MAASASLSVGDRVSVYLDPSRWQTDGWHSGTLIRIDPYSSHRSFHWVELDVPAEPLEGGHMGVISVLNPRNIRRA